MSSHHLPFYSINPYDWEETISSNFGRHALIMWALGQPQTELDCLNRSLYGVPCRYLVESDFKVNQLRVFPASSLQRVVDLYSSLLFYQKYKKNLVHHALTILPHN